MALRLRSFFLCLAAAALCVLSLGSHTAYAQIDEYDFVDEEIQVKYSTAYYNPSTGANSYINSTGWLSANVTGYRVGETISYSTYPTVHFFDDFLIKNDVESLVPKENSYSFDFHGLHNSMSIQGTWYGPWSYYLQDFDSFEVWAYGAGGQYVTLTDAEVSIYPDKTGKYVLTLDTGVVPFETYQIWVRVYYSFNTGYNELNKYFVDGGNTSNGEDYTFTRLAGFDDFFVSWTGYGKNVVQTEQLVETNKGILETVKSIATSIIQLPSTIWSVFETGLTNLFVPDDQAISDMQEDWNNLLADRFGALYQVTDLVTDFAAAFTESEQKTVTLPEITVPVGGDGWTFGGWEIQVVPEGMEVLFTTLKTLVSIVATFLFVNGLKRRFEGLIGGAPTA